MAKAKATSRVLKTPLWQDIVYMALVFVGPIVVTCLELFESHSTPFKWSIASIGSLLITVIIIRKYLFASKLKRYEQECYDLEHDYSIANGNDDLIIARWKKCKMILYAINALEVLLSLGLAVLFVKALVDGLVAFKGAITLIFLLVLVGMLFKMCCFIDLGDIDEDTEGEDNEKGE